MTSINISSISVTLPNGRLNTVPKQAHCTCPADSIFLITPMLLNPIMITVSIKVIGRCKG